MVWRMLTVYFVVLWLTQVEVLLRTAAISVCTGLPEAARMVALALAEQSVPGGRDSPLRLADHATGAHSQAAATHVDATDQMFWESPGTWTGCQQEHDTEAGEGPSGVVRQNGWSLPLCVTTSCLQPCET